MAKNQDEMTVHVAVFPSRYSNGTNPSGTKQNGTRGNGALNGMAPHGTNPLNMPNDNAVSQTGANSMNGMNGLNGLNGLNGMNGLNGLNGMNGFSMGRPSMSDRSNPVMRASESINDSRASTSSSAWQSRWTSTRSTTRDSSQTREPSSLGGRSNIESTKALKDLRGSSDVWNEPTASSQTATRSVRTSPVRRDSSFNVQDTSNLSNTSQNFFGGRAAYQRPTNGLSDHQGQRYSDGAVHAFGHQARLSGEDLHEENLRHNGSNFLRKAPITLQSPTDASSGRSLGPSRNGSGEFSLPHSRNGSDYQGADMGRFVQQPAYLRARTDWKSSLERNDLQQSDLTSTFAQMNVSNSRNAVNHGRSQSSAPSPQELYPRSLKNLANGHDEVNPSNGVAPVQSGSLNNFQNPFQQQQSDPRSNQRGGYQPISNQVPQDNYGTNSHAAPAYPQLQQDPVSIAALNLQLQQQQQLQFNQQQMLLLQQHAAVGYRPLYAPHQPTRMNPQQPYQYPMMPMPPAMMAPLAPAHPHSSNDATGDTRIFSPKLNEFKATQQKDGANRSSAKRWELKDISGHVVEFSGDQHGSRFIQSRIESANSDEKEKLFQEILPEAVQLTQDLFGNWVIQKLFDHGDQAQKRALADKLKTKMYALSTQMYACRVVQHALSHVLSDQQNELARELEPWIEKLAKHQHGNHVIQCSVQCLDSQWVQTVLDAVHPRIFILAKDQFGCRVIQRLLEHSVEPAKRRIFDELHPITETIITDQFGNYVAQNMMKHGSSDDRSRMINLVKQHLLLFAKNKFASNVVEKCLTFGSIEQRRELMEVLIQNPDYLCQLIQDSFGNYVVQHFLSLLEDEDYSRLVEEMKPQMVKAKATSSGKQIAAIEKHMHKSANNGTYVTTTAASNAASNTASSSIANVGNLPALDPLGS